MKKLKVCECEGSFRAALVMRGFVGDVQYGTCMWCGTDRPTDGNGNMIAHPRMVF